MFGKYLERYLFLFLFINVYFSSRFEARQGENVRFKTAIRCLKGLFINFMLRVHGTVFSSGYRFTVSGTYGRYFRFYCVTDRSNPTVTVLVDDFEPIRVTIKSNVAAEGIEKINEVDTVPWKILLNR